MVNQSHELPLIPSSIGLTEIVISSNTVEKTTQIGNLPGLIKLNHKIAHFLPGYGDNSVLNLIRLMPGILAAGEQTSELIIWGSYAGQIETSASRISLFAQDNILATKTFSIVAGFRFNYAFNLQKAYFEPRISASLKLGEYWKINVAMGIYNQFVALSSTVDEYGNYRYLWVICDNEEIPVLEATHYVLGTSLHQNNFTFSLEGYYKSTTGLTRYVNFVVHSLQDIFYGKAESYGFDLLVKKDFNHHSAWIAYSLSKTMETFTYYNIVDTRRAPQDQRHELKIAGLLNFDPFFFSSNYVLGSGFPYGNSLSQNNENSDQVYSRLDVSAIYKFLNRKVQGEVGISLLNVLNTKNVKYSSFEKIPANQTSEINILAGAIPFTPTLYLKIAM